MHDTTVTVSPLLREGHLTIRLIKDRTERDEFPNPVGRFAHDGLDDVAMTQSLAGGHRVGHMIGEVIERIEDPRDPTLSVRAVRLADDILRREDHLHLGINGQCRANPGDPRTNDQHVGKQMRHPLRIESDEIAAFR